MAGAGGVSQAGGATKRLFKSDGSAWDGINFGAVAGSGTASVCRVGYSKRHKDFRCCRPCRISGSKLLFEVVSEADWPSPNQMA